MQHVSEADEQQAAPGQKRKRIRQHFVHWSREDQLKAFFAWLPEEVHDAPGIDWTSLPPQVMGYCVRVIRNSPEAAVLAVIAAVVSGSRNSESLYNIMTGMNRLLQSLRSDGNMISLSDLRKMQTWENWLRNNDKRRGSVRWLKAYSAVERVHYARYLLRLDEADRLRMERYALPSLPPDLLLKYFSNKRTVAAQRAKRKEASDVLVPLYPVLRQVVRMRKQLAERMIVTFREARRKVESGEAAFPFTFSHADKIPEVNRDARTVSEVQIVERVVTMNFTLWDKPSWVLHQPDRYTDKRVIYDAKKKIGVYSPEQNVCFVQYHGEACDLLWFGDLIEHRLLRTFKGTDLPEEDQARQQMARKLGFTNGCFCERPGVLNPAKWFSYVGHREGEFVFDPEALYRGVLFGAALAMIALSNGSRMSELLQVSWNKERRVTRSETILVLDEGGQPCRDADGRPITKQVKIHLQYLLPKGAKSEEERQLFPLSKECMRLLGEIKAMLEEAHGEIPVVHPSRANTKYEDLKPERYLFQWGASPDGQFGGLSPADAQVLLRFILHGLELYTAQGKPIRVSSHLLRHVMATHARQYRHVPPEVIAHFFLHHRLKELTGRDLSVSDISDYYFMMTEEQRFAVIRADLDEQEEMDRELLRAAPIPRDLAQKNADLQAVYDEWHALHPTALGNCGCPGLCPRGNDRSLCLGCSYHVEDPEKLGAALVWRAAYAQQAALFESQGNDIDARQARIKVQQLDDVINVMRIQLLKEAEGSYIPLYKVLPSPHRKAGGKYEAEI